MSAYHSTARIMSPTQSLWGPGGWTPYRPLIAEDEQVFAEAMKHQPSGLYLPQTVAYQVLAGKNYRYKCRMVLPDPAGTGEAEVEIAWPLGSLPYLVSISSGC